MKKFNVKAMGWETNYLTVMAETAEEAKKKVEDRMSVEYLLSFTLDDEDETFVFDGDKYGWEMEVEEEKE